MPPAGKCRISGNVVLMGESGFAKAKPQERRSTPLQLRFRPRCRGGIHASRRKSLDFRLSSKGSNICGFAPQNHGSAEALPYTGCPRPLPSRGKRYGLLGFIFCGSYIPAGCCGRAAEPGGASLSRKGKLCKKTFVILAFLKKYIIFMEILCNITCILLERRI